MDEGCQNLGFVGGNSSFGSGYWSKVQPGTKYKVGFSPRFYSPADSSISSATSTGRKRKWGDIMAGEGAEHSFLTLGLGRSPSSSDNSKISCGTACTMSSAKENDEESSMDMGLSFELCLGNENTCSQKKFPTYTAKNLALNHPKLDLQLSLSSASPESVVTNATKASVYLKGGSGTAALNSAPSFDEKGSQPSSWVFGNHWSSSCNSEGGSFPFVKFQDKVDSVVTESDISSTIVNSLKDPVPVACTSGATNPQQRTCTKHCQVPGCTKGARGASGRCIAHGGGRRCQKPGCQKGAEGKTIYCKAHGGGRRCQHLGCTKSAEGRTDFCIAHGGGRRCIQEGCSRAARGRSGLCIRHGGGKRCKVDSCTKSAEGHSGLCISHGGGRRCLFEACTKGAQGSTKYCKAHGGGKRCTYLGCTKGAEGSTPFCKGHGGGKRCSYHGGGVCPKSVHGGTQFCVAHGGGKRCAVPGCTKSARGRTDHCVRHGGGKRCMFEGCGKSAQGSTDYCKAHGGGKRCSWGQLDSSFGAGEPACDKFARSKTGLCAAHSALVQDYCVHGGAMLGPPDSQSAVALLPAAMTEVTQEGDTSMTASYESLMSGGAYDDKRSLGVFPHVASSQTNCPEGRVRGGSLIALLSGDASFGSCSGGQANAANLENGASGYLMRGWM